MPDEVFNAAASLPYSAAELVTSINSLPAVFGQLNADPTLFPVESLDTSFIRIEIDGGTIRALPATPGGRPSTIARHDQPKGKVLEIPNVSHEDSLDAVLLRSWYALVNRSRDPEARMATLIERRLNVDRLKFDLTQEIMKITSIKGQITDGAGTVLYDLHEVFDLQQRVVYFALDNEATNVRDKIEEVYGGTEDAVTNETMDGVEAYVSREFYNKLISHKSIEKYFAGTPAMVELLNQRNASADGTGRRRRQIELGGVLFREYRDQVTYWGADVKTRLLSPTEGYSVPTGTQEGSATYVAPPLDVRELDGAVASYDDDLIHISEEIAKHGNGVEWKLQMNALPIWQRPALTAKLSSAASA